MRTAEKPAASRKGATKPSVQYELVLVTDSIAKFWLEHNAHNNRGPKPRKIKQYAHDMLTGNWLPETGDNIKITSDPWVDPEDGEHRTDERMIDGGQRMRAVRLAAETKPDVEVEMTFAFGVPYEAIYVTDTGSARTFADGLGFKERPNRNSLGAIVRRVWMWDQGNFVGMGGSNTPFIDPTMKDLHDLEEQDIPGFNAATSRGLDVRGRRIGNPTAAGTAFYVLNRIDPNDANAFFDQLISGANVPGESPILALRDRLIAAHQTNNRARTLTTVQQLYLILRAWNAFRKDETMTRSALILPPKLVNARFIKPI